jgi:hypothetical protein
MMRATFLEEQPQSTGHAPGDSRPVRAFHGILIEHYEGAFPPLIPGRGGMNITDKQADFARS